MKDILSHHRLIVLELKHKRHLCQCKHIFSSYRQDDTLVKERDVFQNLDDNLNIFFFFL